MMKKSQRLTFDFNQLLAEKAARAGREITRKELTQELGVSRETIRNLINGKQPNFETAIRLMVYFDVCPHQFLTEE